MTAVTPPPARLAPRLSARQRAMLAEMGIRVWGRNAADADSNAGAGASTEARASRPARPPRAHVATSADTAPRANQPPETARAAPPPPAPGAPPSPPQQSAPATPELTPRPAPDAIAAMDWPALEAAVTACRACALCAGRTQTVFGVGSQRADWMVVGEAPGEQEDRLGQPFVGPSGQLLDRMLAAIGVSRTADAGTPDGASSPPAAAPKPLGGVYIANVLKCRPPGNRNPQPEEVACCEPYLRRQVALVQPKIILAMGRFAVQSLLQTTDPIGRLRGRAHAYHGVPVIVTYHPAYLLRSLPEKAKAWQDLCLALETAQTR